jgi:hypothetical protein
MIGRGRPNRPDATRPLHLAATARRSFAHCSLPHVALASPVMCRSHPSRAPLARPSQGHWWWWWCSRVPMALVVLAPLVACAAHSLLLCAPPDQLSQAWWWWWCSCAATRADVGGPHALLALSPTARIDRPQSLLRCKACVSSVFR